MGLQESRGQSSGNKINSSVKNELGNRYGRLVVLKDTGLRDKISRTVLWECLCDCGDTTIARGSSLRSGYKKSCGCLLDTGRPGATSRNWKGGRSTSGDYIKILMKGHPRASNKGYVLEHIVVMEKAIGRSVGLDETIHHKNGDKHDNRIENLELRAGRHGRGQAVKDLISDSVRILKKYAPQLLRGGCGCS